MEYFFRRTPMCLLALLLLTTLFARVAWAQGGTGELTGLVTDPSGAAVANAAVTLTNSATGEKRTATTSSAGSYRFPALLVVGTYTLEITAKGFKGYKVGNIVISVGTVNNQDARLEVGTVSETVTVEAGTQLVQTTESSISDLVDRRVWEQMPLETRSQNEFIGLLAGVEPAAQAELGTDRGAAVNGSRSGTGNFLVEGFDNNDQGLGGGGSLVGPGGANTTISPDAIQEYRVIEHVPPAEYGKAGGFVTDTVLKSGTNNWHGSLFEYNRIQTLAANSWFSNNSGTRDHLVRNQFGGSVGGPIIKDKTFFFATLEGHRVRSSSPLTAPAFTSDFVNFVQTGAFEAFQESGAGGLCMTVLGKPCLGAFNDSATTGPIFNKMQNAQHVPFCVPGAANCKNLSATAGGLYTGGLVTALFGIPGFSPLTYPVDVYGSETINQPSTTDQLRGTLKVDQNIGTKDRINAAYLYDNADSNTAYLGGDDGPVGIGPSLPSHGRAQNAGVTWAHTFSPTLLNEARVAYVRHTANFPGDPTVAGNPSVLTAFDSPLVTFGNASNLPQFFTENEFVFKNDITVTKGRHNFKGGGEYRRTRNGSRFDALSNGLFEPNGVEDLLTDGTFSDQADTLFFGGPTFGSFAAAEASVNPTNGQRPDYYRGFRANEVAGYFQDDWRIHPRLTLNLGVRWEYFGPPHNFQSNIDSDFYTGVPVTPVKCNFAGTTAPCNDTALGGNPFFPVNNPFYAGIATGTVQVRNHNIWNKDLNNFGPRVGFAWDTMGNQKLVMRGGFGVMYDRMYNNIFENIRFNPPFFAFSLLGTFGNGVPKGGLESPGLYSAPFTGTSVFAAGALSASLRDMDENLVTAYYEQANYGFQYEIAKDFVLETNYVGTFGHKLMGIVGANTFDGREAGPSTAFINPNYSSISLRTNCCDSNYHALQVTARKRFTSGLQFNVNYTYSKAMDDISDAFSTKNASGAAYPTDSENVHFDYGPADFDVRHRLVASYVYDLPFAKGHRWIGGWSVSGIVSAQSGTPFNITDSGFDSNKDGQFNDRASWLGSGAITSAIHHGVSPATGYLVTSGWAMPGAVGLPGLTDLPCPASINQGMWCEGSALSQMQRNSLVGPKYFDTDFGVSKAFKVTESSKLTFQANFFNLFNHPNFLTPDGNLADITSTFGKSLSTFAPGPGGARVTQLALRFDF